MRLGFSWAIFLTAQQATYRTYYITGVLYNQANKILI